MPQSANLAPITALGVALVAVACTPPGSETRRDGGRRAADGGTASSMHDAAADSGVTAVDGATPVPTTDADLELPEPHPMLADLADNTALDLGRYDTDCEARLGEGLRCRSIVSYSRFNYDPFSHRLLLFGGGHAATGRTDVDVFDLRTLTWASLYPSMTCAEIAVGDIDPRGFHRTTGHPVARHTYDQNVIADVGGVGRLLMFSSEGFSGQCHDYNAPIGAIASLTLTPGNTTWEYGATESMPWGYARSAELDPVSGMVIVAGKRWMWVVDPATLEIVASVAITRQEIHANLVFFPPTGRMYNIVTGPEGGVSELTLNREDWSLSTMLPFESETPFPTGGRGFAYDSHNQVIVGAVVENAIHVFDPEARTWTRMAMNIVSADGAVPESGRSTVALDYDPIDNVILFMTYDSRRTWAYRYRR